MDPISIEALRIFTFENRKGLSEAIIDMCLKYLQGTKINKKVINIYELEK